MNVISNISQFNFLTVNYKQKIRIRKNDIVMMEGHSNYTLFYLENGKQKMFARTLGHFQEQLSNDSFIRCHRTFLINPNFITGYNKEENKFFMQNNLEASISKRRKRNIMSFFKNNSIIFFN
jgi:DNA-binding LytR/AlgR family response regulator